MKGCILVVDDDAGVRDIVHDLLSMLGYQVVEAVNGYDALAKLSEFTPSLILLDLMMPDMDGLSFAQELRNRNASYPLVACSAGGDVRAFARQINAIGYLEKPFHLVSVVEALPRWMEPF